MLIIYYLNKKLPLQMLNNILCFFQALIIFYQFKKINYWCLFTLKLINLI